MIYENPDCKPGKIASFFFKSKIILTIPKTTYVNYIQSPALFVDKKEYIKSYILLCTSGKRWLIRTFQYSQYSEKKNPFSVDDRKLCLEFI